MGRDAEDFVERYALRHPDVVALAPDGERGLPTGGVCYDLAVEQARDGAETREGAVDEKLRPHLPANVVRDPYVSHRSEHLGEQVRPASRPAVGLADDERRPRCLGEMTGPQVGRPPLHRPNDEVPFSDDGGYTVLHEPVSQRDEGLRQAALYEGCEGGFELGRLEGNEGEVERAFEG
jgi:hypothetical protein